MGEQLQDTGEICESCGGQGYLDVCTGATKAGKESWQVQWCEECWVIMPDHEPPSTTN